MLPEATSRLVISLISFAGCDSLALTMLHIILLDSALELVPSELWGLKPIQRQATRKKKRPGELLLDQTHHGKAMTRLEDHTRRGRPDIVYLCLMTLLETPLCKQGLLSVHLHLHDGRTIEVNPEIRLPRNYDRFTGLMEQLLVKGRVPPQGDALMSIEDQTLSQLISALSSGGGNVGTWLASERGTGMGMKSLLSSFPDEVSEPVIVGVGAFPHGTFSPEVEQIFEESIRLDKDVMMAWHACAEIVWLYTQKMDVLRNRLESG